LACPPPRSIWPFSATSTITSIGRATCWPRSGARRPDGELFLVDFRREPGRSPAWLLDHVRAGEAEVQREIVAAGFTLVAADHDLHDNYALRFRRAPEPERQLLREDASIAVEHP